MIQVAKRLIQGLTLMMVLYAAYCIVQAPMAQPEAGGIAQKLFYCHLGSAGTMYAAFLAGLVSSLVYLRTRDEKWDQLTESCHEVGLVFCSLVLVSGPMWARPVWGTWWRWGGTSTRHGSRAPGPPRPRARDRRG